MVGEFLQGYNWRTDPQLMCGMSIESLSHDIDLIRWIAGEIVDVRANIVVSNPDLEGFDDNAHVVMTLSNGGTAVIHASWSSHLGMNARGVIGTLGTAVVDGPGLWAGKHFRWKTCEMEHEHIEVIDDSYATSDCYEMESRHFIDCIANDLPPAITGVRWLGGSQGLARHTRFSPQKRGDFFVIVQNMTSTILWEGICGGKYAHQTTATAF